MTQPTQNYLVQKFQTYVDDWSAGTEGVEYDLAQIKSMPITFIVGDQDDTCTHEHAMKFAPEIGTLQHFITLEGEGHGFFDAPDSDQYFAMLQDAISAELVTETVYTTVVMDSAQALTAGLAVILAAVKFLF